jgi:hypothetical protein
MINVSITRKPNRTLFAYPDYSAGYSLADWSDYKVELTEEASGVYTGQLDERIAKLWRVFEGANQPSDWSESKGFFTLSRSTSLSVLKGRIQNAAS